jgi:hypothetical protein
MEKYKKLNIISASLILFFVLCLVIPTYYGFLLAVIGLPIVFIVTLILSIKSIRIKFNWIGLCLIFLSVLGFVIMCFLYYGGIMIGTGLKGSHL